MHSLLFTCLLLYLPCMLQMMVSVLNLVAGSYHQRYPASLFVNPTDGLTEVDGVPISRPVEDIDKPSSEPACRASPCWRSYKVGNPTRWMPEYKERQLSFDDSLINAPASSMRNARFLLLHNERQNKALPSGEALRVLDRLTAAAALCRLQRLRLMGLALCTP